MQAYIRCQCQYIPSRFEPAIAHMNDPPLPRYNRTNSVPREVLASVVDDFNSGDSDLVRREWFGAIHAE